jgi:hypothetical protein
MVCWRDGRGQQRLGLVRSSTCSLIDMERLFEPYCFYEPIKQHRYWGMLKNWFITELEIFGTGNDSWLQPDGAAGIFRCRCDGILWWGVFRMRDWRGWPVLCAQLDWPPRNPDLSTCDSSFCGYIKGTITRQLLRDNDDLKEAARLPFNCVIPQTLQKMTHGILRRFVFTYENEEARMDSVDN